MKGEERIGEQGVAPLVISGGAFTSECSFEGGSFPFDGVRVDGRIFCHLYFSVEFPS